MLCHATSPIRFKLCDVKGLALRPEPIGCWEACAALIVESDVRDSAEQCNSCMWPPRHKLLVDIEDECILLHKTNQAKELLEFEREISLWHICTCYASFLSPRLLVRMLVIFDPGGVDHDRSIPTPSCQCNNCFTSRVLKRQRPAWAAPFPFCLYLEALPDAEPPMRYLIWHIHFYRSLR